MWKADRTLKAILAIIAVFLGIIAMRPFFDPPTTALAQSARFDHVFIASTVFLYKGNQGMLVMDRRNANVWFIPKVSDNFQDPIYVMKLPFEKLDHAPQ
jgi:hypothetical protein